MLKVNIDIEYINTFHLNSTKKTFTASYTSLRIVLIVKPEYFEHLKLPKYSSILNF